MDSSYATTPIRAAIGDMAWMAGAWRGSFRADPVEEHWSEPAGNGMMGMFRWLRDGQPRFYELTSFEQEGDELLLRIKHFNPGLIAWEEKDQSVTFVLVSLDEGEAVFWNRDEAKPIWIFYRRLDPNTLITYFERGTGGHSSEEEFRYRRFVPGQG